MKAFSILLDKAAEGGYISGDKFVGKSGYTKTISHLYFLDDTIIFCKDLEDQLPWLGWILAWFKALSGLRINLDKSSIILVGRIEKGPQLVAKLGR